MGVSDAMMLSDEFRLPTVRFAGGATDDGSYNEQANLTVTNAPALFDFNKTSGATAVWVDANPQVAGAGQIVGSSAVFVTFEPLGGDLFIRMRHKADPGAAGTTAGNATNGLKIPNGTIISFWIVDPFTVMDVISSVASQGLVVYKSNTKRT